VKSLWALMRAAEVHRIWFTSGTCDELDAVVGKLRSACNMYAIGHHAAERRSSETTGRMLIETCESVSEQMPKLRETFEADFRTLSKV
jgi:hypothetical protein